MTTKVIVKQLAAEEDLLLGEGQITQTRNGQSVPVTKIALFKIVHSNAELQALDTAKFKHATLVAQGYSYDYYFDGATWQPLGTLGALDPVVMPWTSVAGGTLTQPNQAFLHPTDGNYYSWAGEYPKVVAPGTDPSIVAGFVPRPDAALRIGTLQGQVGTLQGQVGTLQGQVETLESQVETIPPSLPGITNGNKFFLSWGEAGVRGYIISRRKNGGLVAVAITNEVAPPDSSNVGGESNCRPGKALQCSALKLAKTRTYAKTAGVVVSSLTTDQIRSLWGYTPTSLQRIVETATFDFSWASPNAYVIPQSATLDEAVTYKVNDGSSASIVYGSTPGSSNNVQIDVSHDGITFTPYATINASGGVSGSVIRREFLVSTGYSSSPWYVRITNKTADLGSNFYVAGLNIFDLPKSGKYDFDSVLLQIVGGVADDRSFQMVNGANEFAAFESSSSKWFGTYHGGHSGFIERLRADDGTSIDIRAALSRYAYISESFELFSESAITTPGGVNLYYSATTQFGDGNHITTYAVHPLASSSGVICDQVFTHMCTTAPNFEKVTLPKTIIKEDDGIVSLGNVQHCKQDRVFDPSSIRCWWSGVKSINNSRGGLYLSFLPLYNKQYYGPILDTPTLFSGGMFTTAKEYM